MNVINNRYRLIDLFICIKIEESPKERFSYETKIEYLSSNNSSHYFLTYLEFNVYIFTHNINRAFSSSSNFKHPFLSLNINSICFIYWASFYSFQQRIVLSVKSNEEFSFPEWNSKSDAFFRIILFLALQLFHPGDGKKWTRKYTYLIIQYTASVDRQHTLR